MTNKIRNVTKQLLGAEDVLFGRGTVNQRRGPADVSIHRLDLALPVADEAELAITDPEQYPKASIGSRNFVAVNGQYQEVSTIQPVLFSVGAMMSAEYPYAVDGDTVAKWTGAFPKTLTLADQGFTNPGWLVTSTGLGRAIISETVPSASFTREGVRWYKPSESTTYVYYCDGDSCQWVQEPVQSAEGTLRQELGAVYSDVPVGGVEAFRFAARYKSFKNIMDYIPKSQHAAIRNHTSVYDCTAAILAAIADYPANTGAIHFPAGLFISDPIDLLSCENIALIGASDATEFPYSVLGMTVLRARTTGDAMILTAALDQDSYAPGNSTLISTIKNILVDCVNRTQVGITTARGTRIEGCTIQNAILDGVTLESGFYPVWLSRCFVRNNGRHGIILKGPYSTLFSFKNVEASYNGASGVAIFDGSTGLLKEVAAQSNGAHGFSVVYADPTGLANPIFLERITFEQCYSEANGGWGILTDSYNTNPASFIGKINELTFINCSFNSGNGQNARLRGLRNIKVINSPYLDDALDPAFNTVSLDRFDIQGWSRPASGLDLTKPQAGKILFPSTPVLSTDPNTLDAYAEGAFVPLIEGAVTAGTATYSAQTGNYTRIGNRVFFSGFIAWSGHTGTGPMRLQLGTFPFVNGSTYNEVLNTRHNGFGISGSNLRVSCDAGGAIGLFWDQVLSTGAETLLSVQAAGELYFSGSFKV